MIDAEETIEMIEEWIKGINENNIKEITISENTWWFINMNSNNSYHTNKTIEKFLALVTLKGIKITVK